jgi:hypothetical protein
MAALRKKKTPTSRESWVTADFGLIYGDLDGNNLLRLRS